MLKELIKIKGTKNGLVFYFNTKDAAFEEIKNTLLKKFHSSNGFFAGAKYIISPDNDLKPEEVKIIEDICTSYGMVKSQFDNLEIKDVNSHAVREEDKTEFYRAESDAVLLVKNLRSGQRVHVSGHAVILGDVNPGAQIGATGNIIVMGCLRGTAHAGTQGDDSAYVMAYRMKPSQIRVSDKVCRAPESFFAVDYPEVALVVDGTIVVQPYQSSKRKVVNL